MTETQAAEMLGLLTEIKEGALSNEAYLSIIAGLQSALIGVVVACTVALILAVMLRDI